MGDRRMHVPRRTTAFLYSEDAADHSGLAPQLAAAGLSLVGSAASLAAARSVIEADGADVALLDADVSTHDCLSLCEQIRRERPDIYCVLLTTAPTADLLLDAVLAGASGVLRKDTPPIRFVELAGYAAKGIVLVSPGVVARAILRARGDNKPSPVRWKLTERELAILELLSTGAANRQIAHQLEIAEKTVKVHVGRILAKLDVTSRAQAARLWSAPDAVGAAAGAVPFDPAEQKPVRHRGAR
jgi:DNA-binding NarL/FixJ family response regulator